MVHHFVCAGCLLARTGVGPVRTSGLNLNSNLEGASLHVFLSFTNVAFRTHRTILYSSSRLVARGNSSR